jgi:UDP-glucose 4-epimerase
MAIYLITGGAGFIGSHLAERLVARGDSLRVLDNLSTGRSTNLLPGSDLVVGDIRDAAAVAQALRGVDGVFHLAAVSSVLAYLDGWSAAAEVNALGSLTVFEAAARAQVPLVYASSAGLP